MLFVGGGYNSLSAQSDSLFLNGQISSESVGCSDVADSSRHLTLKTNTLGLGLLIANTAVEIELSRRLSLHLPVYYSALDYFCETVKFRTLAIQPELRYRILATKGLFAGLHFGTAYFNLAAGGQYRIQDREGRTPMLGGGISLGYRLNFKKNSRWGMEFAVGGGAYTFDRDRFINEHNGPYVDTVTGPYIGLDNLSLSLTYDFRLGGKSSDRKEGRR